MTKTDDITRLERFEGCLIGGAAGDALGYPVEFSSYEGICARYGAQGITSYAADGFSDLALFSDDTQMTLFTAEGLLAAGPDASRATFVRKIHRAYLDWLKTQEQLPPAGSDGSSLLDEPQLYARRAPGNTCLSALRSHKMGLMEKPLDNSKGCGGVMRVAPVGLFVDDADEAAFVAAMAAAITHGHSMGYVPAAALAFIVNRCVYGDPVSLQAVVGECIDRLPTWFDDDRAAAEDMGRQLARAAELAAGDVPDAANIKVLGEGWVGDEALAIAVYACLRHEDDFGAALVAAVNHDGDSDSTGAIAGNVMGAWLGLGAIGPEWTERLELRDLILRVASDLEAAV